MCKSKSFHGKITIKINKENIYPQPMQGNYPHEILKRLREGEDLTEMGNSFHNLGKETKTVSVILKYLYEK